MAPTNQGRREGGCRALSDGREASRQRASARFRSRRSKGASCAASLAGVLPALLSCALLLSPLAAHATSLAQSGRVKPPTTAAEKRGESGDRGAPRVGPIAEPPEASKQGGLSGRIEKPRPANADSPTGGGRVNPASEDEEATDEDVVRISSNLVPLPVSVVDPRGEAVTDLRLEDFELLVEGQPRPLAELSRAVAPANIVLLFDNSWSLNAARSFQKQAAIRFFKTTLRPIDRAAVYSLSTAPELVQPLTSDVGALIRTIESFSKPEGATALFDTLDHAAEYLDESTGRKIVIIVSDGTDTVSRLDFDRTLARLVRNHIQVYAVRIGHSDNTNLRDLAGEHRFREFAAHTGGAVYTPRSKADFDRAFREIAADLSQQYILSYYPSDDARDGRFRPITLRVKNHPAHTVRTRKGYYPPKG